MSKSLWTSCTVLKYFRFKHSLRCVPFNRFTKGFWVGFHGWENRISMLFCRANFSKTRLINSGPLSHLNIGRFTFWFMSSYNSFTSFLALMLVAANDKSTFREHLSSTFRILTLRSSLKNTSTIFGLFARQVIWLFF